MDGLCPLIFQFATGLLRGVGGGGGKQVIRHINLPLDTSYSLETIFQLSTTLGCALSPHRDTALWTDCVL